MRKFVSAALIVAGFAAVTPAFATETIAYTYDAKGRLVKVEHTGSVNNNLKTEYTHDKADNRSNVKTTGSPN
ncbi:hypothetical protein ACOYW6_09740 [Parablastomonas sp. CN1-191]|uniref:hypothetical protein n=1 Tax=Parablastomonas sp. CN1-191 TaxID=3400908 RepID=UPI003BF7EE7E